MDLIVNSYYFA